VKMLLRKMVRKLQSLVADLRPLRKGFWSQSVLPADRTRRYLPRLEQLDERIVPTVTVSYDAVTQTALIKNDATAETITTTAVANQLVVTSNVNNITVVGANITGNGTKTATFTSPVKNIYEEDPSNLTATFNGAFNGLTTLRFVQLVHTGGAYNDDHSGVTNTNLTIREQFGTGTSTYTASAAAVNIVQFGDAAATSNVTLNNLAATTLTALDFGSGFFKGPGATQGGTLISALPGNVNGIALLATGTVSTDVVANLASTTSLVAQYNNVNVNVGTPGAAQFIQAVYGGKANDLLTGNDSANLLIGGDGNDTIIGKAGNDQLNASRAFDPSIRNDRTQLPTLLAQVNANTQVSATAKALASQFFAFDFGEGPSFLQGGYNFTNDFNLANAIVGPTTSDLLQGGGGNDGLFGFNGAAVTALGEGGDDIFSSNFQLSGALNPASTYLGGDGADFLVGAVGSTIDGGAGADNLSFVVQNTSAIGPLSRATGGTENDTISAGFRNVVVDASENTDAVTIANFAENTLIYNNTTFITGGIGGIPLVSKALRP